VDFLNDPYWYEYFKIWLHIVSIGRGEMRRELIYDFASLLIHLLKQISSI